MSTEAWEIVKEIGVEDIEIQLALQCAPLITGLKISNLFRIQKEQYKKLLDIIQDSGIEICPLGMIEDKITVLLYRERALEAFLSGEQVRRLLKQFLCMGDWKVYKNPAAKQRLFQKYDDTRENLVQLLSHGITMEQIIDICDGRMPRNIKNYNCI